MSDHIYMYTLAISVHWAEQERDKDCSYWVLSMKTVLADLSQDAERSACNDSNIKGTYSTFCD